MAVNSFLWRELSQHRGWSIRVVPAYRLN